MSCRAWASECLITDIHVYRKAATIMRSEKARALQKLVWGEIIDELKAEVPELHDAGLGEL